MRFVTSIYNDVLEAHLIFNNTTGTSKAFSGDIGSPPQGVHASRPSAKVQNPLERPDFCWEPRNQGTKSTGRVEKTPGFCKAPCPSV